MWRCALRGVTPLYASTTPHVGGWPMNASSRRCAYERTLRSPQPFLFRFYGRGINKEESTRLRLPAAEGSGTFQPHRMIPNHSNLAAETQSAVGPQPQSRADFHSYHTRFPDQPNQRSYTRAPSDWPAEIHAAYHNTLASGTRKRTSLLRPTSEYRRPTHQV